MIVRKDRKITEAYEIVSGDEEEIKPSRLQINRLIRPKSREKKLQCAYRAHKNLPSYVTISVIALNVREMNESPFSSNWYQKWIFDGGFPSQDF